MDRYLLEHPAAMPTRESAMTYLFASEPAALRLVEALEESYAAVDEAQETALSA